MNNNLSKQQQKFWKLVDEILFYKWDPIGVSDSAWARDEYRSYLPRVFSISLANSSPESIAKYLTVVTTENMGLSSNSDHDLAISKLILEVKESVEL